MRKLSTLLLLLLIAIGAKAADFDLAIENASLDQDLYLAGDEATLTVNLVNNGDRTVSGFTIMYSIDGSEGVVNTFTTTLNSTRTSTKKIKLTIPEIGNGIHQLTVKADLVRDDVTDEVPGNNTVDNKFVIYNPSDAIDKKSLMEQFTTIKCVNCPYGDAVLDATIADRDDVVWIAHHVGYGTDELTIDGSNTIMNNYGINYAPAAMLDRTVVTGSSPVFGLGYSDATAGASVVNPYITKCVNNPTFIGFQNLSGTLNADKTSVTINVKGTRVNEYAALYDDVNVTVYLVENNCYAAVGQTGNTSKHYHDNVIRAMLNSPMGTAVEWNGNEFEYTVTADIDSKWNTDNLRVVALINKPFTTTNASQVLNCDETALVSGESDSYDISIEKLTLDNAMCAMGDSNTARVSIKNVGTVALNDYSIDLYLGDKVILTKDYTTNLNVNSAASKRLVFDIPEGTESGEYVVKAVIRINGHSDINTDNNSAEATLAIYDAADAYKKTVLLEQFTTIKCVNCPYGDAVLEKFMEDRDNAVWVAHHVGYYTDELTIDESNDMMTNFGINFAPGAMLNRTQLEEDRMEISLGYSNAASGAKILSGYMDTVLATPVFVGISGIGSTVSEDGKTMDITVVGERNPKYASLYDDAYVTVYLVENNCYAVQAQSGDSSKHYHDNVIRHTVTPIMGTPIEWNGNTFTYTATSDVATKWNTDNMRVVAFINKPYTTSTESQVYNAAEQKVGTSKVHAVNADNYSVSYNNGSVSVAGASNVEVYSIDGRRVANSNLNNGLYLIRFTVNGKVVTLKHAF